MKVEQAKQIASKAIDELSQALERGHSETLRTYLAAMARFPRDLMPEFACLLQFVCA